MSAVSISSILVALLLVLAACAGDNAENGDDDGAAAEPETPTTEPEPEPESTETTEPEPVAHPSPGCEADPEATVVEEERTLTVDDVERRYLLTVPSAHDGETPLPVVFSSHGLMEGADIHSVMTAYSALAKEEGFVVVFPHGTDDPVRWNTRPESPNPDVVYFDAVLDQVNATLCIDESRVYATGLSNGAMFTSVLICERADVIAAAAPVAGIMDVEPCDQSRPVPLVSFHGTADGILLFNGGVDISGIPGSESADASEVPDAADPDTERPPVDLDGPGYPATIATFAERNGCDPDYTDTEATDELVHRVYDCPDGADVEFYIVVDGGHTWPSSEFSQSIEAFVGYTTFDIDATRDSWEFMSRFTTR